MGGGGGGTTTTPGKQNAHWCQATPRRRSRAAATATATTAAHHARSRSTLARARRQGTRARRQQGPRRAGQAEPSACLGVRRRPPSGKLLPPRPHLWARLPLWVSGSAKGSQRTRLSARPPGSLGFLGSPFAKAWNIHRGPTAARTRNHRDPARAVTRPTRKAAPRRTLPRTRPR